MIKQSYDNWVFLHDIDMKASNVTASDTKKYILDIYSNPDMTNE